MWLWGFPTSVVLAERTEATGVPMHVERCCMSPDSFVLGSSMRIIDLCKHFSTSVYQNGKITGR